MKPKYFITILTLLVLHFCSCERGFEETNINPILGSTIDPTYQLVRAEIIGINIVHYEGCIVQQVTNLLGGNEEAGNRNTYADSHSSNHFNSLYGTQIQNLVDAINTVKNDPYRS